MTIPVKKLDEEAILPTRNYSTDAGLDLYALEDVSIVPGDIGKVKTGVAIAIPKNHVGLIMDRSGLGSKGYKIFGGVIDHGYTGDCTVCIGTMKTVNWFQYMVSMFTKLVLPNFNSESSKIADDVCKDTLVIKRGDKIAQLVIVPILTEDVVEVDELPPSERGNKGFGSSGK